MWHGARWCTNIIEIGHEMAQVVVGVDGSAQSLEALTMAVREARWRSCVLRVVYVYEPVRARQADAAATVIASDVWPGSDVGSGGGLLADARRQQERQEMEAQRAAEARLRQFVAQVPDDMSDVEIEHHVVPDRHASSVLLGLSDAADLLVVGSRGLGGFAGLLMGSVSQQCVQHATCAVLVARPVRT